MDTVQGRTTQLLSNSQTHQGQDPLQAENPSLRSGSSRRVVITGLGVVSPLGLELASFWSNLAEGRSGVGPLSMLPAEGLPFGFAGEADLFTGQIDDYGPLHKDDKKVIRKASRLMCRESQMGVAAAQRAWHHAGLDRLTCEQTNQPRPEPERAGVTFGTGYMVTMPEDFSSAIRACTSEEGQFEFGHWGDQGRGQINPLWLLKYLPNMPACHIAIYNDLRGPNNSLTHGEAAANLAVGEAAEIIVRGQADVMLTGATGTRLHPLRTVQTAIQEELASNGPAALLPEQVSRPFDRDRTGMVVGEGAAALVLEDLEHAIRRGATIYGEVLGYGSSCVPTLTKSSQPSGLRSHRARAGGTAGPTATFRRVWSRRKALANAIAAALRASAAKTGRSESIGHIHAHGLSTRSCDAEETAALYDVFQTASRVPVVAAKGHFGNLGAGGGAVELVASILALHHGHLFPVLNYQHPDPDCAVAAVRDAGVQAGTSFLNLSVNSCGQASCLMVRRFS